MNSVNDPAYEVLPAHRGDSFREHVVRAYEDAPSDWQKVLGDQLHFQWGVFDHPDSPRPVSLDEAGLRHLERQLAIATGLGPEHSTPGRVLDVGCGWGATLRHLARVFPDCRRLDGINISAEQLAHCAEHVRGADRRVHLYLCDAADIAALPDAEQPYDLVVVRGTITHFPPEVYETATEALAQRMRPGALLVISETLYSEEFLADERPLPSDTDHLALGHRKSLRYVTDVLRDRGFDVRDQRVLPSAEDAARWVLELKSNIDVHFPEEASPPLEAIRSMAATLAVVLLQHEASVHSIVAERREAA
ncbi:methyltransferase domain-containing protein [Streptomyces sp. AM 4-1-1]|uniref:SAM-dependent methyltransferase n=1 Tax=Streptomyces sp. AM 4-1-1 TaxID=3028710 RepID=UPI0023B898EB|nr:class I SAM-dependent methyltransferase [Streptomyces sp. AM 4-1-1]WEH37010.1 methyltransferase domain-containing protein [Streptomyces sp. AM 4-1-1]